MRVPCTKSGEAAWPRLTMRVRARTARGSPCSARTAQGAPHSAHTAPRGRRATPASSSAACAPSWPQGDTSLKQCCLCPIMGGALKPTTLGGGQWCHAACMQWIPGLTCLDPSRMEPVDRIQAIEKERWELQCYICKQRVGARGAGQGEGEEGRGGAGGLRAWTCSPV